MKMAKADLQWKVPKGGPTTHMSTRETSGVHYENHQREKELRDLPTHVHRVGEQHGKQDHLSSSELSRRELEQSRESTVGHGIRQFSREEISARAYELWKARGCPEGSPDVDCLEAVKDLRARALNL